MVSVSVSERPKSVTSTHTHTNHSHSEKLIGSRRGHDPLTGQEPDADVEQHQDLPGLGRGVSHRVGDAEADVAGHRHRQRTHDERQQRKEGEVAGNVFERYRLATYREASHKPFVIAAMILLTRFEHAGKTIKSLLDRGAPRRGV